MHEFLLLLTIVILSAPASAGDDIPPPERTGGVDLRDPAVIGRGLEILGSTCGGYCHGTEGRGFKAPSLRNRTDLSADSMFATISFGRKRGGKLMPAWKGALPDTDIWTVIGAVISLRDAPKDLGDASKPGNH